MSPRSALISCYRLYFDFTGRASRAEFWWFAAWLIGGLFVSGFIGVVLGVLTESSWVAALPMIGWFLVHAVPFLAVQARRLHDWGRSGWWLLLHIAGIGSIIVWVMMLPDTEPRANRWGPPLVGRSGAT